jgi:hypothetical protein
MTKIKPVMTGVRKRVEDACGEIADQVRNDKKSSPQ